MSHEARFVWVPRMAEEVVRREPSTPAAVAQSRQ